MSVAIFLGFSVLAVTVAWIGRYQTVAGEPGHFFIADRWRGIIYRCAAPGWAPTNHVLIPPGVDNRTPAELAADLEAWTRQQTTETPSQSVSPSVDPERGGCAQAFPPEEPQAASQAYGNFKLRHYRAMSVLAETPARG
jgi:hypothetical protein